MERIRGLMVDNTLVLGKIIICMVMVLTLGKMEDDMRDITKWIKSMALVYINGLMVENMKVTGLMVSSMVKANIFYQMGQ